MSIDSLKTETVHLLADADERVMQAEHDLAEGEAGAKVKAAGNLAVLKRQRDELRMRLGEIEKAPRGRLSDLAEQLKEEGMLLKQSLQSWASGH
ncbi:MAG TPA: hypothetical protein VF459_05040 [Caulobacteraceae bacterium]